jgi:hypothetical protein
MGPGLITRQAFNAFCIQLRIDSMKTDYQNIVSTLEIEIRIKVNNLTPV